MSEQERIAQLEAENTAKERRIAQRQERVAVLEAQVQHLLGRVSKDSHNSSKPPVRLSILMTDDVPTLQPLPGRLSRRLGLLIASPLGTDLLAELSHNVSQGSRVCCNPLIGTRLITSC
jgi:hypothetical protein